MSYLDDYLFYSSENEAPTHLHKWAALVTIAAAVSRKVWVDQGTWQIYPHLYVLFVGDPASGKSVAMDCAELLVHDFSDIAICPAQITREALTKHMANECAKQFVYDGRQFMISSLTFFCDEFVTLLGTEPIRMIEFLTAVYAKSGDFEVATKNKGVDLIKRPCLVLLGCLTPQYLTSMVAQNLITGGFTRRVLPVLAKGRGPAKPRPRLRAEHYAARDRCVAYANTLSKLIGPLVWTPDAEAFFDDWYRATKDPAMRNETNDVMRQYFSAKDQFVIKVAILLSLMEKPELVLTRHALEEALKWLEEIEPDRLIVFGGGGRNDLAVVTRSIQRFICERNGVSLKQIKGTFMNDAKDQEILQMLTHLVDTDAIERRTQSINGFAIDFYHPPTKR